MKIDYPVNETLRKLILEIIAKHSDAKDNDKLLMMYVWDFQGLKFDNHQKDMFMRVFSPESIRRTRQKIQEDLPSLFGKKEQRLKFGEIVRENINKD